MHILSQHPNLHPHGVTMVTKNGYVAQIGRKLHQLHKHSFHSINTKSTEFAPTF